MLLPAAGVLADSPPVASSGPKTDSEAAVIVDPLRPSPLLEKRSYIWNMKILAHHAPGEARSHKINMMAVGDKRYIVQGSRILDVSNPLKPKLMSEGGWKGGHQIQVAYSQTARKWIAMTSDMMTAHPGVAGRNRGMSLFDISDPRRPALLGQFGNHMGTHRNYWDGGRYAYLSGSPDGGFHTERTDMWGGSTGALQIVDMSDPTAPKAMSEWHLPGQRGDEGEARKAWSSAQDRSRMATLHGPEYVPVRIEDGGRLGYGPWAALGMMIHDLSDPLKPKLISRWQPDAYVSGKGGMAFHTIDIARLNRKFVIANPETFWPQCREAWHDSHIIDVSDPAKPKKLATLPIPRPPAEAPYRSFCDRYGRFGAHNPPHLKAPGTPHPNFTCFSYFAAGLQCYDLTDPRDPKISAFFVPEQGNAHTKWEPLSGPMNHAMRTVDNVFIEWDRKLIWAATDSGLYVLSAPALGEPVVGPMAVREWTLPAINKGFGGFQAVRASP
ncbi:MAG: hypothetical protein P8J20_18830 [Novosphingobium sp.]|nr:hypothetical protein [Novosphingobium sp.]